MADPSWLRARQALGRTTRRARALSPVVRRRDHEEFLRLFRTWFPVGHFYSPYPDLDEVERRADAIFAPDVAIPGVDLREDEQLDLFAELAPLVADLPFPVEPAGPFRYHLANPTYAWGDGVVLHALLRHIRPRQIIEVGSGYSSAMLLDTAEGWLDGRDGVVPIRFIEPNPELLLSLLHPGDRRRTTIDALPVQDVPLEVFDTLAAGDVLFIDSTHVTKAGSDVNHLYFNVLPRLASGVWIHIHDVFMPFEYPREWVLEGRAWQEAYLLRAFLMYNEAFAVRWFQSLMWLRHREILEAGLPGVPPGSGGNIWLQRT